MSRAYALPTDRRGRALTNAGSPRRAAAFAACALGLLSVLPLRSSAAEPSLYERVKSAMSCDKNESGARYCEYKLDGVLDIGIKDVGGANTVVGFRHSDVEAELYAVLYGGCIAIVPGKANKSAKHRDYGVFISPRTGELYRSSVPCEASLK